MVSTEVGNMFNIWMPVTFPLSSVMIGLSVQWFQDVDAHLEMFDQFNRPFPPPFPPTHPKTLNPVDSA